MDLSVFFAGTGGSIPTVRRGLPALLVRRGGDRILFDCGEGTQRQLVSSGGLTDLDEIFITPFPRRSLPRAPRPVEDVRPPRARAAAGDPRAAGAQGARDPRPARGGAGQ